VSRRPAPRRPPPRRQPVRRPPARRSGPPAGLVVVGGLVAVVVLALVVALAAGGGGGSGKKATTPGTTFLDYGEVQVTGTALPAFNKDQPAKGDGLPLPTIRGQSPKGELVTIAPTNGMQVVIVGAPWCPHCNKELPQVASALQAGTLGQVKVTLVVSGQLSNADNWPPGNWVFNTLHWPSNIAPVMLDDKASTAAAALGTPAYPYFVFVDSQGRVGSRDSGEIGLDKLVAHIRALH
jgi:cytochrome c biogenesis protein CcmG, thiol:disulfide interchange protein DsbE